jgi:hypothetical protein
MGFFFIKHRMFANALGYALVLSWACFALMEAPNRHRLSESAPVKGRQQNKPETKGFQSGLWVQFSYFLQFGYVPK